MITNIIHGKMAKLKCIKHILNKNDKIYANIFCKISKLANLVKMKDCRNEYTLDLIQQMY